MEFRVHFGYILVFFNLQNTLKLILKFSKFRFCKRLVSGYFDKSLAHSSIGGHFMHLLCQSLIFFHVTDQEIPPDGLVNEFTINPYPWIIPLLLPKVNENKGGYNPRSVFYTMKVLYQISGVKKRRV